MAQDKAIADRFIIDQQNLFELPVCSIKNRFYNDWWEGSIAHHRKRRLDVNIPLDLHLEVANLLATKGVSRLKYLVSFASTPNY